MRLKIALWKTVRTVHMQVIVQLGIEVPRSGGFVMCLASPQLHPDYVCLRGAMQDYDNDIANLITDEPDRYIELVLASISNELFGGQVPTVEGNEYLWDRQWIR